MVGDRNFPVRPPNSLTERNDRNKRLSHQCGSIDVLSIAHVGTGIHTFRGKFAVAAVSQAILISKTNLLNALALTGSCSQILSQLP